MKLQLDTTNKTIKIEELVNLGELTETLEKILPNGLWKEFKLDTNVTVTWGSPIVVKEYLPYKNPYAPFPWITYGTGITSEEFEASNYKLTNGTYNIEV